MRKTNKGFTLVELIIVIAILAIIMLIAIPNFSGIQQRMKVRADKATAAQIGKAVRVWYTDHTSGDPTLTLDVANNVHDAAFVGGTTTTDYRELSNFANYASTTYEPDSLVADDGDGNKIPVEEQYFVVGLTSQDASTGKVCVGIVTSTPAADEGDPPVINALTTTGAVADYNGEAAGFAYVEK